MVLCSADYYSELEIKRLLSVVDEFQSMPNAKRRYKRANSFLKTSNTLGRLRNMKDFLYLMMQPAKSKGLWGCSS